METKFLELIIPLETLRLTKTGLLKGTIFFRIGDFCFPDSDWEDLVDQLFCLWIGIIWFNEELNVLDNHTEIILQFMDGPDQIRLTRLENELFSCVLETYYSDDDVDIIHKFHINLSDLKKEIKLVCLKVLHYCYDHKLFSDDIDNLREVFESIEEPFVD